MSVAGGSGGEGEGRGQGGHGGEVSTVGKAGRSWLVLSSVEGSIIDVSAWKGQLIKRLVSEENLKNTATARKLVYSFYHLLQPI